jgi:hydroxypyruvate isomerase
MPKFSANLSLPYPFIFEALDRLNYDGWVGCEYRPKAGSGAGLGWMGGKV